MPRFIKRHSKKAGTFPGTLIHIGEKKTEETKITFIDFDEAHLQEQVFETIEEAFPLKDLSTATWINIDGLHDVDIIEKIGVHFIPITFVAGIYGMNFKFMPELE
ncbi:MAG: hypothetical protein B6I30_08625 [Desulfobacteraceae bacterium 4572_187]|nr:MAG: hypothetical protein B6I30_08625 [Desulfobacteraceae bacterium 4572_187]